jgi:hypothetical protein
MNRVRSLIGELVTVSGDEEFDLALNKVGKLQVQALERATEEVPLHEMFWLNKSASQQAREQRVGPLASLGEVASSEAISQEDLDVFARAIDEARREG